MDREGEKESKKKWKVKLYGSGVDGLILDWEKEKKEGVKEGNGGYVLKNRKPSESTWRTW